MKDDLFSVEETSGVYGAKIKVFGVGGGGGNMINHMIREGEVRIDLIAANTDAQALDKSQAASKIQLGSTTTRGLGAGMQPEVGAAAAEESREVIKNTIGDSDIVIIAAGLGGGTGTGAAPVIARTAKESRALTIGVVTTPFEFEGKKRMKLALQGAEELKKECDSLIVIQNQKLLNIIDKNVGMRESFKKVDSILARAVSSLSSIILDNGDINLDFSDIKKVMGYRGLALIGVGQAQGEDAAKDAVNDATQSPLLNDMSINGAMGVLILFRLHPDYPLNGINEAMKIVHSSANPEAEIIWGTMYNEDAPIDEIEVMLIATGFDIKKDEVIEESVKAAKNPIEERILKMRKASGFDCDATYEELENIPSFIRDSMD